MARAAELFARHGYHATSMNQVAEAAGLSKATLYHYYRDKDALLVHIADEPCVSGCSALVARCQRARGLDAGSRSSASWCGASSRNTPTRSMRTACSPRTSNVLAP